MNDTAKYCAALAESRQRAAAAYQAKRRPARFFEIHTAAVQTVLTELWHDIFGAQSRLCLLTTGGFGRGELYPFSDLDLALASPDALSADEQEQAERFVQALWDMQLAPAVKIGTQQELCASAHDDITGDTAFLEARFLCGSRSLAENLLEHITRQRDTAAFAEAKLLEMRRRHTKSQGSGALLEPNIKTCPGGLRDIHTVLWLAKAHGLDTRIDALREQGVITRAEAGMFTRCYRKLAAIRIELHLAAGRAEDRLLFDLQANVAERMNPSLADASGRLKSETLMQEFYRATKTVKQLAGILIPILEERIAPRLNPVVREIDEDYRISGNRLTVRDPSVFLHCPQHIFRAVSLLQTENGAEGMSPETLRGWWAAVRRTGSGFYADEANRRGFLGFFRHGNGLTRTLRFLNLYGVLGRYLPAWEKISGLLQHDLFHIYPVDEHILTVVHNMRRLATGSRDRELPLATSLMQASDEPHILYLAAFFHDIAKGRGGDHAVEGIADAERFAADHGLTPSESSLLAWLVEDHLLMSSVAQKEDIHDPDVINHFCARVQTQERLTALYLLTVADIRGTNPKLWNSWRASLLENLFHTAARRLAGETGSRSAIVNRRQQQAAEQLTRAFVSEKQQRKLWHALGSAYFVRHDLREILWHTANLAHDTETPQVRSRILPESDTFQVMVFMPNGERLFARLCRIFSRHGFDILAARAFITEHNFILDTFIVQVPAEHHPADYPNIQSALEAELTSFIHGCAAPDAPNPSSRLSRRSRHMPITPSVKLSSEEDYPGWHTLEITAVNRAYLLADIAEILFAHKVSLRYAKIATLDERAEDSFVVYSTGLDNPKNQIALKQALLTQLAV
ncbi:[protein-PII] uridylyltransferase [Neisseria sp.]|uniref:[protein-PII] uridylyltransferase n=1 Tax=Neisseria sp. TaxID=192066 RepID=UPI0035A098FC